MHREAWSINKIIAFLKQFLFFSATHSVLYIIGNSNFPTTRIVESPERRFDSEGALKFDAWRSAAFTFPYKTRIAQFPAEARIISVSNKIQRQTLAGNARFLLTPKAPPSARHPASSSRSRFCSRSNSRSLLFITTPTPRLSFCTLQRAKHCAK